MADLQDARLSRIEEKLDRLGEAMELLARIDERQTQTMENASRLGERIEKVENRVSELEKAQHQASPLIDILKHGITAILAAAAALMFGPRPGG